ncbi:MAG: hypothetical protein N0E48_20545 [Candidatus Thiodiazotropha endolucinida]|nr:hypothetical protein [Candidatus Thiodiazotropha taylori]MCW4345723.1 hypothetical protein [Candidatus Thiodiazotropha endolucinida]
MRTQFTLLNIQGLITKYTNKLLSHELQTIFEKNDFILLTEEWASEIVDLSADGFNLINLNREDKNKIQREVPAE